MAGASGEPRAGAGARITIAICTYRRPGLLAETLAGIARQEFGQDVPPTLAVVVVDNEGNAEVRRIVDDFTADTGIAARCAVEPRRGIAQARNAALDLIPAESDFAAFIDDDEIPSPGWLCALLATQRRADAAVVCGPVLPAFKATPPPWIVDGGFFRQPRRPVGDGIDTDDGAPVGDASTNNALVRLAEVRSAGLRFDEAFRLTGGEDAVFFRKLAALGARMVWSPDAAVSEHIPAKRTTFAYLAREYFRCGNVRAAIETLEPTDGSSVAKRSPAATTTKKALKKAAAQLGPLLAALVRGRGRAHVYGHVFELANAAGRLAYLLGYRYEHYR